MNSRYLLFISLALVFFYSDYCIAASPFNDENLAITSSASTPSTGIPVAIEKAVDTVSSKQLKKSKYPITGKIEATNLRLRSYPWGPVIGTYSNDDLTVIGEEGEFYKVTVNGVTGYMHKNYISVDDVPASTEVPDYPENTRSGGYIGRSSDDSDQPGDTNPTKPSSTKSYASTGVGSGSLYDSSRIGAKSGNETVAGAITWAKDQLPGGSRKGVNSNRKNKTGKPYIWKSHCLAFIATAYGRKYENLRSPSAIGSYYKFKNAGLITNDKNPPAGAVMFTDKTSRNRYGHIFMATGETDANGEPLVITNGLKYPQIVTLSKMIGNKKYLGWAMPQAGS